MQLTSISHNQEVEIQLYIPECECVSKPNNKSYLQGTCMNYSGTVPFKVWGESDVQPYLNQYLSVKAKGNEFNGKFSLILSNPTPLEHYEPELFFPSSPMTVEKIKENIEMYMDKIKEQSIKEYIIQILSKYSEQFYNFPAAKTNHDNTLHGLAYHTLKTTHLAYNMCKLRRLPNCDLVIAGAILHDIGKILELTTFPNVDYTLRGKLEGHLVLGLEILEEFKHLINKKDYYLLRHVIVSHHGKKEWGSPQEPKTIEALIIHHADLSDAYTTSTEDCLIPSNLWVTDTHYKTFLNHKLLALEKED